MAHQGRQLVLGLVIILLGIYFYIYFRCSLGPQKRISGSTQETSSSLQDFMKLFSRRSNDDPRGSPPTASTFHPELSSATLQHHTTLTPASKTPTSTPVKLQQPTQPKVGIGSAGLSETQTCTKGPVLQPQHPTQPARSSELSFIGNEYMTEDVSPHTSCSDGIWSQVEKAEFGGQFLKDIPVLQWAKHVTREQYKRLSKYPGAHGWGSIDYKTLEETLSVLNSSANRQLLDDSAALQCIRCAVVGNGGILKDSKKGKEIDSHHYIFRTNGAITKGFEEDVGSRTTHYTFSTNTLINSMRSYAKFGYKGPPVSEETRYIFLPDHDRDYLLMKAAATHSKVESGHEEGKDPSVYFGKNVSKEKLKMYHPDFIRYLRNRFLRSHALKTKYKDIYRPSTGAVMLLAALHTCDQVSAYGFMTPDYKNYSDHYYDTSYHPVGFFINHDLRMEMSLWQRLHEARLIHLYMHK